MDAKYFIFSGKFIDDLGVKNFGLKDIVQPETKNVVVVLSAVINFARFREDQLVLFEEKSQESVSFISLDDSVTVILICIYILLG